MVRERLGTLLLEHELSELSWALVLSTTVCLAEVAGVTFSDSAHVPKFLKPGLDPKFFQI